MTLHKHLWDLTALSAILLTWLQYAPQIAAVFATLYYITLIYKEWRGRK